MPNILRCAKWPPSVTNIIPTIKRINKPSTSYILFFAKNVEILSAKNNINKPLATIAIAITINAVVELSISLVNPIAAKIESNENTKFIITILMITAFEDLVPLEASSTSILRSLREIICQISFIAV